MFKVIDDTIILNIMKEIFENKNKNFKKLAEKYNVSISSIRRIQKLTLPRYRDIYENQYKKLIKENQIVNFIKKDIIEKIFQGKCFKNIDNENYFIYEFPNGKKILFFNSLKAKDKCIQELIKVLGVSEFLIKFVISEFINLRNFFVNDEKNLYKAIIVLVEILIYLNRNLYYIKEKNFYYKYVLNFDLSAEETLSKYGSEKNHIFWKLNIPNTTKELTIGKVILDKKHILPSDVYRQVVFGYIFDSDDSEFKVLNPGTFNRFTLRYRIFNNHKDYAKFLIDNKKIVINLPDNFEKIGSSKYYKDFTNNFRIEIFITFDENDIEDYGSYNECCNIFFKIKLNCAIKFDLYDSYGKISKKDVFDFLHTKEFKFQLYPEKKFEKKINIRSFMNNILEEIACFLAKQEDSISFLLNLFKKNDSKDWFDFYNQTIFSPKITKKYNL